MSSGSSAINLYFFPSIIDEILSACFLCALQWGGEMEASAHLPFTRSQTLLICDKDLFLNISNGLQSSSVVTWLPLCPLPGEGKLGRDLCLLWCS